MLRIMPLSRRVSYLTKDLTLSPAECNFLLALVHNNGFLDDIEDVGLFGDGFDVEAAYHRLRRRFQQHHISCKDIVVRVWNRGYSLVTSAIIVKEPFSPGTTSNTLAQQQITWEEVQTNPLTRLTRREQEVLYWMAHSDYIPYTFRQLARALKVEYKTLNRYLRHIYRKIGVSSKTEAILFARQYLY